MEILKTPVPGESLEQKEKEQLPILVMYRDNDLYREFMPEIANNLQAWGRKVETQIFPQGTSKAEIEEWIKSNRNNLQNMLLATDHTVRNEIDNALSMEWEESDEKSFKVYKLKSNIHLDADIDSIFNSAAREAVLGKDVIAAENSESDKQEERRKNEIYAAEKGIERIVKLILEKEENRPNMVSILKKKACDHDPFDHGRSDRAKEVGKSAYDVGANDDELKEATEKLKKWLVSGGVPENIISIVDEISSGNKKDLIKPGSWIVLDRHNARKSYKNAIETYEGILIPIDEEHRVLTFPLSNFYRSALEQGLLEADPEEFLKALNDHFKKAFIEEAE